MDITEKIKKQEKLVAELYDNYVKNNNSSISSGYKIDWLYAKIKLLKLKLKAPKEKEKNIKSVSTKIPETKVEYSPTDHYVMLKGLSDFEKKIISIHCGFIAESFKNMKDFCEKNNIKGSKKKQ